MIRHIHSEEGKFGSWLEERGLLTAIYVFIGVFGAVVLFGSVWWVRLKIQTDGQADTEATQTAGKSRGYCCYAHRGVAGCSDRDPSTQAESWRSRGNGSLSRRASQTGRSENRAVSDRTERPVTY